VKAKQFSLSALIFLLPAGVAASPADAQPRIYIVEPSPDYQAAHDGVWRPNGDDIEEAKAALLAYLAVPHPPSTAQQRHDEYYRPEIRDRVHAYILQFAGVRMGDARDLYAVHGRGPKAILVTGICGLAGAHPERLTRQPFEMEDNGTCFFRAIYDVRRARIVEFRVNDYA
jgi:hypothetical protein